MLIVFGLPDGSQQIHNEELYDLILLILYNRTVAVTSFEYIDQHHYIYKFKDTMLNNERAKSKLLSEIYIRLDAEKRQYGNIEVNVLTGFGLTNCAYNTAHDLQFFQLFYDKVLGQVTNMVDKNLSCKLWVLRLPPPTSIWTPSRSTSESSENNPLKNYISSDSVLVHYFEPLAQLSSTQKLQSTPDFISKQKEISKRFEEAVNQQFGPEHAIVREILFPPSLPELPCQNIHLE